MLDLDPKREASAPRDAATVILLRAGSPFEVFMVRRHGKSGFMAGAHVFPGGTLDPEDLELGRSLALDGAPLGAALGEPDPDRALGLHVAAVRETFEEAGILFASGVGTDAMVELRRRRLEGESFARLLAEAGGRPELDALVPFTRWVTPSAERRRYDARFFLALSPASQRAEHDRVEVTEGVWWSPADTIARAEAGEVMLPPPTLRTLEQLVELGSIEAAFREARRRPPPRVQPELREIDGELALTLPGDPLHPEPGPVLPGPTRFVLRDGRFRSEAP